MSEEDKKAFLGLSERINSLYLRVMVLQTFLQEKGIPKEDIEARVVVYERVWKERLEKHLADANETANQETLLQLLNNFDGSAQ